MGSVRYEFFPGAERKRPKIVIAGNHRQYEQYLRDNNLTPLDAVYIDRDEKLRGLEIAESDVVRTGKWWLSDISETLIRTRIRK